MDKTRWTEELQQHVRARRQARPIPDRQTLTVEEEGQCRILGGEFLSWDRRGRAHVMSQRSVLRAAGFDPDPLYVITTSMPGLVALREIVPEPPPYLVYLLHEEFEPWEKTHPVDSFTFHVHHWSFFEPLDEELLGKAQAAYPDVAPEAFRSHQTGDLWSDQCGLMGQHLWHWDGQGLQLLEEAFERTLY